MSQQRRIDLLFAATVRVMDVARVVRSASPALAVGLVSAVAVHGTLGGPDAASYPSPVADAQPLLLSDAAALPVAAVPVAAAVAAAYAAPTAAGVAPVAVREPAGAAAAPVAAPVVPAPARQLDREQQNIAKFIAARYRITVDATSEFVYHAFRAAKDTKVDPLLVLAVMSVESSFNPRAQSSAGAQGLMQVLTRVHVEKFLPFGGIPAAFDPVANIRVGSAILRQYIQREGSVEGGLKSYVGAALAEHDGGYGLKVLSARERIAAAAAGRPIPPDVVVAGAPAPRAEPSPVMLPVSTIVETRTPLPVPVEPQSRAASRDLGYGTAHPVPGGSSFAAPYSGVPHAASHEPGPSIGAQAPSSALGI
jgi:soluble lytic murein transglycosylase-like protein